MRERIIHNSDCRKPKRFPDGQYALLPVDQFPVKDCNINKFGFPKSDITIFDEMTKAATTDLSAYQAFALRLTKIAAEKPNNIKIFDKEGHVIVQNVADILPKIRPAWMQTQAEEREFCTWMVNQYGAAIAQELGLFSEDSKKPAEPEKPAEPVQPKSE